ncbi:MAG: glycosyltransferase family 2 protein [Robiginitomaculum sp.]|nr:glycosyltransferase family 2 protein [Robiginitomaculum sp.]MDQ7076655.1 glycosyltransferase family 2 protein [Robiginitomaculum sp.]
MEEVSLSIVVPVFNEEGNAVRLAHEIADVFKDTSYEMIFVDDASTDATLGTLVVAKADLPTLRVLHHQKNAGQSRAIRTGALAAKGEILGILDGDGQNDPADLPMLLDHYQTTAPRPGMVTGERLKRQDHWNKRLASKLGNAIRGLILRDGIRDAGCGLKILSRQTYLRLPFFDHQHRYMAALTIREGLKVATLPVRHRPRQSGQSKYSNFGRLAVSIRDILGVMWLQSRARRPGDIAEKQ